MKIKKLLSSIMARNDRLLGVEVKKDTVYLVELAYDGRRYCVDSFAILGLRDLDGKGSIEKLKRALKKVKARDVVSVLASDLVNFKEIDIATDLSPKEIDGFLRFNFAKETGLNEQEIIFDYHLIHGVTAKRLQTVAVKREHVEKLIKLFKALNFRLVAIDVDSCALVRAVRFQLGRIEGLVVIFKIDHDRIFNFVIDNEKTVYIQEEAIQARIIKRTCSLQERS